MKGYCGFMIELEELKQIQIDILDDVVEFCETNHINYWLDSGTLLGAIRHEGYIPWDDDIDLGMLRSDYDEFKLKYNEANRKYKFFSVETDKNFNFPYGKVLDLSTELYEPNKKIGEKLAVNIDIFVYDNAPEDKKKLNRMYKKRNIYRVLNIVKKSPYSTKKNRALINAIRIPCHYILKVFPKGYFSKKIINNSKKYMNENTNYVGNFTGSVKIQSRKSIFDSYIKVNFEGKKYNAPVGYHEWLTDMYGNYMELPPKEKQVSHHVFEAFRIDKEN